jgi:PAS domain S-box-containing protein
MLAQIYGYPSAESLISNVTNIANQIYVNPLRRQEFINILLTHDTVSNFESQVYRRDGTKIWISENVRAIREIDGTLAGFEGTVQDISQRKRAEAESQLLQCLTLEISAASDFQTALEIALTKICQFTGWDYGEAWIPSGNGQILICSPAWYSSIEGLEEFFVNSVKESRFPQDLASQGGFGKISDQNGFGIFLLNLNHTSYANILP